jgi:hypothetical protein
MEELRKAREETEKTRQETGALDVRPGEVEGMIVEGATSGSTEKSRALQKRKRDIEERRKLLEAKRRKKNPDNAKLEPSNETPVFSMSPDSPKDTPEHPPGDHSVDVGSQSADPFAAVEARSIPSDTKSKGKQALKPENAADNFLASLEREIMSGRKR